MKYPSLNRPPQGEVAHATWIANAVLPHLIEQVREHAAKGCNCGGSVIGVLLEEVGAGETLSTVQCARCMSRTEKHGGAAADLASAKGAIVVVRLANGHVCVFSDEMFVKAAGLN